MIYNKYKYIIKGGLLKKATAIPLVLNGGLRLSITYIGQGLPELTPVEIVGYEAAEAGSPLVLDNGWFTITAELKSGCSEKINKSE